MGYSLLDVGCSRGELAKYLDSLGIQCTGIDESPKNVLDARRNVPSSSFSCTSINDPLPSLQSEFDVVLIRDSSDYRQSLHSRAGLCGDASVIEPRPPSGCIAFLCRVGDGSANSSGHSMSCYARHLGALPGHQDFHEVRDGLRLTPTILYLKSGHESHNYAIASLRPVPQQAVAAETWNWAVERAAASGCIPLLCLGRSPIG